MKKRSLTGFGVAALLCVAVPAGASWMGTSAPPQSSAAVLSSSDRASEEAFSLVEAEEVTAELSWRSGNCGCAICRA